MTILRWVYPLVAICWLTILILTALAWMDDQLLHPFGWLTEWQPQLMQSLFGTSIVLIVMMALRQRQMMAVEKALSALLEQGLGYQIRNAQQWGNNAVYFNRLSNQLAEAMTRIEEDRHLLQSTLDNVDGVILTVDGKGQIELVTPYVEQAFGWPATRLAGQAVTRFLPQYSTLLASSADEQTQSVDQQSIALSYDGEVRAVSVILQPCRDNSGQVLLVRDITVNMESERETELLRDTLNSSQEGFMLFDGSDQLIWANTRISEVLSGKSEPLAPDTPYHAIMQQAVVTGVFPAATKCPTEWLEQAQSIHESPDKHRDLQLASGKWLREHTVTTRSGGILSMFSDISSDKAAEQIMLKARQSAEQASASKSRFLAIMSHEIRTPLNGLIGMLELLSDNPDEEKHQHYLKTARQAGDNMVTLINDLLDLVRMEYGKLQMSPAPCNLPEMIHDIVDLMTPIADDKGLILKLNYQPKLPDWIEIDEGRLRQVLINLIGNGIKFTHKGSVRLTLEKIERENRPPMLSCIVMDTGVGIAPADQQKLFEEFSMLDQRYNRQQEGAGLGLAISQRLVSMMGGKIHLKSVPNKGSCFWFEIEMPTCEAPPKPDPTTDDAVKPAQILLVEDNDTNRFVIEQMLTSAGHFVDCVSNGEKALAQVQINEYQLVLMDVSMPVMDGIEATRRIRALGNQYKNLPIIAMTAHALPEEQAMFSAAGMNAHLTKPMRRAQLLDSVKHWQLSMDTSEPPLLSNTVPEDSEEHLDLGVLKELAQDLDAERLPELINVFLRDTRKRMPRLARAINEKDNKLLLREVHSLASSSAVYGLMRIHQLSRATEKAGKEGEFSKAREEAKLLLLEMPDALDQLEAFDCSTVLA